jgi:hypothetical protein
MAHKDSPSLDHIDPLWEEGRDYQLVCGRDCERNWRELTVGDNSRKSNRFLPWRYCADEIGQKPCETGDWVQFLVGFDIENDVPGEWVLMEFESPEWFEATREYCAERRGGSKGGKKVGKDNVTFQRGFCKPGVRSQAGRIGGAKTARLKKGACDPEVRRKAVEKAASMRSVPVVLINKVTGERLLFASRNEAAREMGMDRRNLSRVLRGEYSQIKGFLAHYGEV